MVNSVSMDNVEHAYAVQQLRKSGKIAKIVSIHLLRQTGEICIYMYGVKVFVPMCDRWLENVYGQRQ